ncbi:MAG: hypothetical protein ACI84K_000598 [Pseudohongiellaceae bacterium]|jgi:uncharacterized protein YoxC
MSISLSFTYLVPVISSVLVALFAMYTLAIKRSISKTEKNITDMVDGLSKEVQVISHGTMGVGRKVLSMEKKIEELETTIEEIQKNDPSKVSYSEAARLVELGAGVEDLMNSCGISRPEAELVRALTTNKNTEIPTLSTQPYNN